MVELREPLASSVSVRRPSGVVLVGGPFPLRVDHPGQAVHHVVRVGEPAPVRVGHPHPVPHRVVAILDALLGGSHDQLLPADILLLRPPNWEERSGSAGAETRYSL